MIKLDKNKKVWITSDTHYSHTNICRGVTNWRTLEGEIPIEQTRDFTFVQNAVQVNVKGMLTEEESAFNKVYNIAVGERFSVNQLYELCASTLNSDWKSVYREPRPGDIRDSLADISLAKKLEEIYIPNTEKPILLSLG